MNGQGVMPQGLLKARLGFDGFSGVMFATLTRDGAMLPLLLGASSSSATRSRAYVSSCPMAMICLVTACKQFPSFTASLLMSAQCCASHSLRR